MKQFPKYINSKNKNKFSTYLYSRVLCYLRREIYEHILNGDENNYFELDKFANKYLNNDMNIMNCLKDEIINELELLNWKCKTTFGDTALFIYSTEKPPSSCW